ncbi:MAG: hypothetical protein LBI42_06900 [Chitinispirillales bacterium]|nr:hypothetical protein [Chitinispirillales bacterium]
MEIASYVPNGIAGGNSSNSSYRGNRIFYCLFMRIKPRSILIVAQLAQQLHDLRIKPHLANFQLRFAS